MRNTRKIHTLLVSLTVALLVVAMPGCYTQPEPGQGSRAVLKGGQTVSVDMNGWVAVPNTMPEVKKSGTLTYAVLATHNVISAAQDGWVAMDAAYFTSLTDVKVEAPKGLGATPYVLKEGRDIPKDVTGWVAVPPSSPKIEKSAHVANLAMAELVRNQLVPKEMNGWVAVDRNTLSELANKKMMQGKGADLPKVRQ